MDGSSLEKEDMGFDMCWSYWNGVRDATFAWLVVWGWG